MGLETFTFVDSLNTSNPVPGDDKTEGDDHMRGIKTALKNTFPNATRAYYFPRGAAKTLDFTVVATDLEKLFPCDCTADHIDVTLPALTSANDAWVCRFVKTDATANTVRIAGTINGDADGFTLTTRYQGVTLFWTGTEWIAFQNFALVDGVATLDDLTIVDLLTLSSTARMLMPGGTTAQRPGVPVAKDWRYNSDTKTFEYHDGTAWRDVVAQHAISGQFQQLTSKNNAATPNSKIDIDALAITVETGAGFAYRLLNVDLTIDATVVGANGIDVGALANDTWYYRFVIYNPTTGTTAGLLSTSQTAPTMPSGYTAKAYVGACKTNGTAQIKRFQQYGRRVAYAPKAASSLTAFPTILTGTTGTHDYTTMVAGDWAELSVAAYVPSTAGVIHLLAQTNDTGSVAGSVAAITLSPSNAHSGIVSSNPPPWAIHASVGIVSFQVSLVLEGTSIFAATNNNASSVYVTGWEENL